MRILLLKNKKVIDLENKQVSSWNYIDNLGYEIYYFNRDKSDLIYESQIQKTFETLEDYCAYQTVTITTEEYNELTSELTKAKEELASKNEYIRKLLMPFMHAKIPPKIFEKIENGEFENEISIFSNLLNETTQVIHVYKIKSKDYLC